ncbi:uncharacterized protein L201_007291 [Kwoniella dendrophila CBS 6074]|uniref:BTB domain-containing protein n=1 Tax=Kwoniella dendrophila CBS 6074 TaxID=1295534 RepID=A0AAX4K651_9TREE
MTKHPKDQIVINDLNKDFQSADSDLIIRSSDDIIFKIHRFYLQAMSEVFRERLSTAVKPSEEIHLEDSEIEGSVTIAHFLNLCCGKPLTAPKNNDCKPYQLLIRCLRKYDCPGALTHLEGLSYKWFHENLFCPANLFAMGHSLNSVNLATCGLSQQASWRWAERSSDKTDEQKARSRDRTAQCNNVVGASTIDPSGLSRKQFKDIPDDYKFALLRATSDTLIKTEPGKSDWKKISEDFQKIMLMKDD